MICTKSSFLSLLIVVFICFQGQSSLAQSIDKSFNVDIRKTGLFGNIGLVTVQKDDKILISGDFY